MKYLACLLLAALYLALCWRAEVALSQSGYVRVTEADGSPSVDAFLIRVPDGSLTVTERRATLDFAALYEAPLSFTLPLSRAANLVSLTNGNLTASGPLALSATRQLIGGSAQLSIADADAASGAKGAVSLTGNDFNTVVGHVSLDYVNGQKATASQPGFLSSANWSTFNGKVSSQWLTSGAQIYYSAGSVGIGTTAPGQRLDVNSNAAGGTAALRATNSNYGPQTIASDVRASVAGVGTYTATAGIYSPGIYGWVPAGGHGTHAIAGLFERQDQNVRVFLGGTQISINAPAIHVYDVAASSTQFIVAYGGNVGVGVVAPNAKLEVNGGVRLNTAAAKPTCDDARRGTFWVTQAASGVQDSVQVCAKDAANAYAWRTIY